MSLIETPAKIISGTSGVLGAPIGGLTNFLKNPFSRSVDSSSLPDPDYPEGFIIEEILDNQNDAKKIVLLGNMMPKQGIERSVNLRSQKEMYPGNDEPTIHILGSEESDFIIKGRFYDKKYTDKDFYGVANEMREALEEMAKRKPLVRLTLGEWKRYALLNSVKTTERRLCDIDYEVTFTIFGPNRPRNYQLVDRMEDIPIEVNSALIAEALEFQRNYSQAPDSVPASIADILNDLTGSVASVINLVTGFVDTVVTTGEEVTESISRAVGLIRYARNSLITFRRRAGSISYSLGFSGVKVPQRYRATAYIANSISATNGLQEFLNQLLKRFEALSRTVPLARHRVIVGDTLQKISTKFYGSPDFWKRIYDHNKLSTTELVRGAVLEIPKL